MATPVNASVICPIVIGRASELACLHALFEQTKSGKGQVVLLSGEAGVGKSRLATEVRTSAARMGFTLLQGNCFETDRASPYGPFLDLFRTSFTESAQLDRSHDLPPFAQQLALTLSERTAHVAEHGLLIGASSQDPQQEQLRLFAIMLRFVTEQAARHPLLLIIEDLHWSDETSLELLKYLARKCKQLPILFLLTYRSEEVSPELRHFLAACDREHLSQDIVLRRLTHAEVEAMLQTIFAGEQAVSTDLLESLYSLTEGNPFFIEEMLKSLLATGEITNREGVWERTLLFGGHTRHPAIPRSVQDAVYQRTKQLSASAKQILSLAAVAGRDFDLTILQRVIQIDESRLLLCMRELVEAQLVREETADRFSFRHALTRQAVYAELLAGERRSLHRLLARTIEEHVSLTSVLDAWVEDLAYHFFEGGVWSKAAEYGQRAGERALMLYSPRAAIEHFSRTLDALSHSGSTPPAPVLRARGQAYATIGAFEQARLDYERVRSIAKDHQDRVGEWQSLIDLGFLWAGRDYTQAGQWFRDALDLAQGLADPRFRAHSLNRVGNWLVNIGRVADGLQAHQDAVAIFEALQDNQGLAETSDLLGMAYGIYGDSTQAVVQYDHAIRTLRALNDRQGLISSLTSRVAYASPGFVETTFSVCESPERCSHDIMEALSLARQADSLIGEAFVEWVAGLIFASFGQCSRGLVHARESLRIATEIQHPQWLAAAHFTLGRIYSVLLEANLAVQAFEQGLALAHDIGSAWWVGNITAYLAQAYLLQGALPRAEAVLQAVMPRGKQPMSSPERRVCWSWGELALANNEAATALTIADLLLTSTPQGPGEQPIPWLLKLKGEALAELSYRAESLQVLEEARRGALAREERPLLWQIHRALGRQYRRLKQENLAWRHITLAREGITSLASGVEDAYLREHFLQAALATLPKEKPISSRRASKDAFGGLTERERTVVRMVAQGKSNREIADALVVTKRTVETHINNIKHKLALTSRARLVVWAVERGMLER